MFSYDIYTDSSCDLPKSMIEQYDLKVMQLEVTIDDKPPVLNRDVDVKTFYDQLREGANAKTAAVTPGFFEENMRESLEAGKDIIYIGFTSGLSVTYNNGAMIAEELKAEFPERKILYIDTLCASAGEGMLVHYAALQRETGASIEDVYQGVIERKDYIHHLVTVNDLFFLKRGGRISATTAVAGSILNVKPLIHVSEEGKLETTGKIRGRKAAIKDLFLKMKSNAEIDKWKYVFISHGDCLDDVTILKDMIEKEYPGVEVTLCDVGPVIGAHTGPGVIALFYLGNNRKGTV